MPARVKRDLFCVYTRTRSHWCRIPYIIYVTCLCHVCITRRRWHPLLHIIHIMHIIYFIYFTLKYHSQSLAVFGTEFYTSYTTTMSHLYIMYITRSRWPSLAPISIHHIYTSYRSHECIIYITRSRWHRIQRRSRSGSGTLPQRVRRAAPRCGFFFVDRCELYYIMLCCIIVLN